MSFLGGVLIERKVLCRTALSAAVSGDGALVSVSKFPFIEGW